MKSTVWRIMLLCVVVSLLVSVASCGDLGEKPEEIMARPTEVTATQAPTAAVAAPTAGEASGFKLGFILPSKMQQRWPVDEAAFIAEAERLGDSAITLYSNEDERLQATQVEQLLAQDIDALVMIAVNAASAEEMVKKVKAEGIPFIAYDRIILNQDVDAFVTRDNVVVGEQMAQMAVDLYPKGNYVIVSGDEGNMVAHEKTKGIMNVLQPLVDKGDIKNHLAEVQSWLGHRGGAETGRGCSDCHQQRHSGSRRQQRQLGSWRHPGAAGGRLGGQGLRLRGGRRPGCGSEHC